MNNRYAVTRVASVCVLIGVCFLLFPFTLESQILNTIRQAEKYKAVQISEKDVLLNSGCGNSWALTEKQLLTPDMLNNIPVFQRLDANSKRLFYLIDLEDVPTLRQGKSIRFAPDSYLKQIVNDMTLSDSKRRIYLIDLEDVPTLRQGKSIRFAPDSYLKQIVSDLTLLDSKRRIYLIDLEDVPTLIHKRIAH